MKLPPDKLFSAFAILASTILTATLATAQVQTFTAKHTYVLGDHDSKDDARQRCLLEAKRKILEQAGAYIESASEVKDFALTKDKITSFAAAVMQVKDTKEDVGFQRGHMTLTLTLTAQVDLAEVRRQLAARKVDAGVREDVAVQKERLKRLEAQLEAIRQQAQQAPGQTPAFPPSDISAADLQALRSRAAEGNATAQVELGARYVFGNGVLQDHVLGRQWWEHAAAQGHPQAQWSLGLLHVNGWGVPQDYTKARQWYEQAAAQDYASAQADLGWLYANGHGVPRDYAKARQWYEQAAAQGDASAQYGLGRLYAKGEGVPQDYVRAYMWLNLAAARFEGDKQKQAAYYRDEAARLMTPTQVAEAQKLAHEWKPKK